MVLVLTPRWLEDRLSTHHDEEQEEEEGGVGVPVAMLAVVLDQIRRTRSRAGQGGAGLLDDTRGVEVVSIRRVHVSHREPVQLMMIYGWVAHAAFFC